MTTKKPRRVTRREEKEAWFRDESGYKVAQKDIVCWKVLKIHNGRVHGLALWHPAWCAIRNLKSGKLLVAPSFSKRGWLECASGVHAYTSKKEAKIDTDFLQDSQLWKATIPTGTIYYHSPGWKYRAEKIKLIKRVA